MAVSKTPRKPENAPTGRRAQGALQQSFSVRKRRSCEGASSDFTEERVAVFDGSDGKAQGDWEIASKGEAYEKLCHALRGKPRLKTRSSESIDAADAHHQDHNIPRNPLASAQVTVPPPSVSVQPDLGIYRRENGVHLPISVAQQGSSQQGLLLPDKNQLLGLNVAGINPTVQFPSDHKIMIGPRNNSITPAVPNKGGNERRHVIDPAPAGAALGVATHDTTGQPQADTFVDDVSDLPDELAGAHPAIRIALSAYLRRKRENSSSIQP
jgi:hypothetical protein